MNNSNKSKPDTMMAMACLVLLALGVVLRFHRLEDPFGRSESVQLELARQAPSEIVRLLRTIDAPVGDPPEFSLLLHFWTRVAGDSASAVHVLTALLGCLAIGATAWAGTRAAGPRVGLLAAVLMAVHPAAVAYSQEARSYSFLILFQALSLGSLQDGVERDGLRRWTLFAASTLAALYAHHYSLYALAAQTAWVAARAAVRREMPSRGLLWAYAAVGAGYAWWLPGLSAQAQSGNLPNPGVYSYPSLARSLYAVSGLSVEVELSRSIWPAPARWGLALAYLGLAAVAARALFRRPAPIAALWAAAGPGALALAYAGAWLGPYFEESRHWLVALPAVCLLWALGLELLEPGPLKALAVAFLLLPYPVMLRGYFSRPKSTLRELSAFVREQRKPGYVVLVWPQGRKNPLKKEFPETIRTLSGAVPADRLGPEGIISVELRRELSTRSLDARDWAILRSSYTPVARRGFGGNDTVVTVYERRRP